MDREYSKLDIAGRAPTFPLLISATLAKSMSAPILPILSCLAAATLWGLFWYPLRMLEALGMPGLWATFTIYASATLIISPWLWQRRLEFSRELARQPWHLFVIAVAAGWCNLAFILAILDGTVVRVLLLFFLSPMWTVLLGWLILRERPDRAAWVTLLLAMSGAVIMLWPERDWLHDGIEQSDVLALSAGFAFALTNVMVRKTGAIPVRLKMISAWLGVLTLTGLGILLLQVPVPEAAAAGWGLAILVGMLGMTIMTFTAQYGVTHLPVYRSAVLFLFEIVVGAVSSWWLAEEVIRWREWLGGGLVVLAAWQSARAERRRRMFKPDAH